MTNDNACDGADARRRADQAAEHEGLKRRRASLQTQDGREQDGSSGKAHWPLDADSLDLQA